MIIHNLISIIDLIFFRMTVWLRFELLHNFILSLLALVTELSADIRRF